ncbi:Ras family GTPase [Klosneuvirus KNV1]|uniref:Ras family GTPase n=1 Tax=Klosneuvirus KNV1 TaxID=1977640 RepID=A0A1V0SIM3_9VIRU|nr:Ras family GTPase [Klosneuvirus KNV1]
MKCILIGASSVGKSALFVRYLYNKYISDYQQTVGVDFGEKIITYADEDYKIQIWDTAGQERFESVTRAFYRNTNCVLYCFSLADKDSFIRVSKYIHSFRQMIPEHVNVLEILVGLCCDLPIVISDEEIKLFKQNHDIEHYYYVSAKKDINVSKLFKMIIENAKKYCIIKEPRRNKHIEQLEVIDPRKETENDSCCVPYTPQTYPQIYHHSFYL